MYVPGVLGVLLLTYLWICRGAYCFTRVVYDVTRAFHVCGACLYRIGSSFLRRVRWCRRCRRQRGVSCE